MPSVTPEPCFRLWPDRMLCPQATRALAEASRLLDSTKASLGRAQALLEAIRAVDHLLSGRGEPGWVAGGGQAEGRSGSEQGSKNRRGLAA